MLVRQFGPFPLDPLNISFIQAIKYCESLKRRPFPCPNGNNVTKKKLYSVLQSVFKIFKHKNILKKEERMKLKTIQHFRYQTYHLYIQRLWLFIKNLKHKFHSFIHAWFYKFGY